MTPSTLLSLSLVLLLFAFTAHSISDPVLDIDRKPLLTGIRYHIIPVVRGQGGGLTLSPTNSTQNCPSHVTQAHSELDQGLPLTFAPVFQDGVVNVSTDYYVRFRTSKTCGAKSTIWQLLANEDSSNKTFVTIGAVVTRAVITVNNLFRIEKFDSDYKITWCHSDCKRCGCADFGIFIDKEGTRHLVLSDDGPLKVMFKKA